MELVEWQSADEMDKNEIVNTQMSLFLFLLIFSSALSLFCVSHFQLSLWVSVTMLFVFFLL